MGGRGKNAVILMHIFLHLPDLCSLCRAQTILIKTDSTCKVAALFPPSLKLWAREGVEASCLSFVYFIILFNFIAQLDEEATAKGQPASVCKDDLL